MSFREELLILPWLYWVSKLTHLYSYVYGGNTIKIVVSVSCFLESELLFSVVTFE